MTLTPTLLALRSIVAIVSRLPRRRALAPLGSLLGWLMGSVLRIRRQSVEAAMVRAGVDDAPRCARRMYEGLGRGIMELLWIAGASDRDREAAIATWSSSTIDADAITALDGALARGPVILFASHTGNWELVAAAAARVLALRGRRLVVVAKGMRVRGVDAFLSSLRAKLGVKTIAPSGAFLEARKALASGDVVIMPIDQVPDRVDHGVSCPFLGADALVDRAPATLAWRARATVLVVGAKRDRERDRERDRDRDQHVVQLLATLPTPDRSHGRHRAAAVWIDQATRTATSRLETFIKSTPESWLWLHRRWRAPRNGAVVNPRSPSTSSFAPAFRRT